MTEPEELIGRVLAAADGEIIGRIRMQKIFYLLEQSGLRSDLSFNYHHYGPYSRDLDAALGRAEAFEGVREDIKHRQVDGMPYSVFTLSSDVVVDRESKLGRISVKKARDLIAKMKSRTSTVLELAATIHWLVNHEHIKDWRSELIRRKGIKTDRGRIDEALILLGELDLSPP